ncbi:MAG: alanine racemase [Candidatus Pacebacteria bacterium]|nr:alanine racemase [Candidatus Paceibacterota bacterium]
MKLITLLRNLRKRFSKYTHTIEVLISKNNILGNLKEYKTKYSDFSFAPVLKSNAYGHGLIEVAKILDKENSPFFVVDSLYEARLLKHHKIQTPILIIGYTMLKNIQNYNTKNFIFTVVSLEELRILAEKIHKNTRIHLKIDTGMHRQGILISEIEEAINLIKENRYLVLEGVCSHLADADNEDKSITLNQISKWKKVVEIFKDKFTYIKYFHLSATAGVSVMDKEFTNLVRLGIGLYGISLTNDSDLDLKPALAMKSIISTLRDLEKGGSVGYNHIYTLEERAKIATVPTGYFEGVDRRLSNLGFFKIKNNFAKIAGRVSMNMTSVDVSHIPGLKIGDEVLVISEKTEDENSVVNIAKKINTIPYEILVHIPSALHRKVVKNI